MAKKDFSGINTGRVYGAIETATSKKGQQGNASPQEAADRAANLKTQGRKGCKAIRINMAFSPEVHEYIKTMARVRGESITDFTNYIFTRSMEENAEVYQRAKEFKESF